MLTQKISMDCTKEQYEKYLKDELLKMGYVEKEMYWRRSTPVFTNAANGITGGLLDIEWGFKEGYDRTYLGEFNAPLFLALAAMTDNPNILGYGEYITDEKYKTLRRNDRGKLPFYLFGYHKSTKSEIIDWFKDYISGNKEGDRYDATKYICGNVSNLKSDIVFNITKNPTDDTKERLDAISLLKSKGYKILKKIENWEEV